MLRDGLIRVERIDFGDDVIEKRTIALTQPNLKKFTEDDLKFVNNSIYYYWHKTGMEASDGSHGVAWGSRHNGDDMPYESAYLSDDVPRLEQKLRLEDIMLEKGWVSE